MQANPAALRLSGLAKSFGKRVVDALDLDVHAGELYALLGSNGAGKTTTLRMVSGLLKPDAGSISIFGIDASCRRVAVGSGAYSATIRSSNRRTRSASSPASGRSSA